MSTLNGKKLCIVSRSISNFYNLDGCSQFLCPKGTVLCGLSFDFDHPEFQQFEYGALGVRDINHPYVNSDQKDSNENTTGNRADSYGNGADRNGNGADRNGNRADRNGNRADRHEEGGQKDYNDNTPTEDVNISFGPVEWTDMIEDPEVGYDLAEGRCIVGIKVYLRSKKISFKVATCQVMVDDNPVYYSHRMVSSPILVQDVQNWFVANEDCVITGIHVYSTKELVTGYFCYGNLSLNKPHQDQEFPFEIIVALHPDEKYYPVNASDYLRVSRLRKHRTSSPGPDPCYDTHSKQFVPQEMNLVSFYNIDPGVINDFHSYESERRLFNLRPHDLMSLKDNEVYLQPMVRLRGDCNPNGMIPVYTRILSYNLIGIRDITYYDFWMFFGYNHEVCKGISFSHQGDWEHVMVKTANGKIIAAWLSQHGRFQYFPREELEIGLLKDGADVVDTEEGGPQEEECGKKEVLRIYCAEGSHTLYPNEGTHTMKAGLSHEHTQGGGYQWKITDRTADLESQPWKDFAGAWGEVGEFSHSTGPLGPWYRRFDFWYEDKVSLKDITNVADIILVSENTLLTTPFEESRDKLSVAPKDTVFVGLKHCGDENGTTRCVYSTLKAIDHQGNPVEGRIEIKNIHWDEWIQESDSLYNAPAGYVILDRQHVGDENGQTRFKVGRITFNGQSTAVTPADAFIHNQIYIESKGVFFRTSPYFLMIGSQHTGDENGLTVNFQGLVTVTPTESSTDSDEGMSDEGMSDEVNSKEGKNNPHTGSFQDNRDKQ